MIIIFIKINIQYYLALCKRIKNIEYFFYIKKLNKLI